MSSFRARMLKITCPADAGRELARIGADPGGIGHMAPKMLQRCIHIADLQCRQANILKQEMLSLGGDAAVARGAVACSIDSTDVILIGTERQLRDLCRKLPPQPFGLAGLSGTLSCLLDQLNAPPGIWRTARRVIQLERPQIMGILNITPDSFSDGSHYLDPGAALDRALQMIEEGADIIDIGGETTKPGSLAVAPDEELRRIMPVLEMLVGRINCPVSIDTRKSSVADATLKAGAEIINDVSGLAFDKKLVKVMAEHKAGVVLMHTKGTPDTMQQNTGYTDLIGEIIDNLEEQVDCAIQNGVARENIAIDPGIGFGKDVKGNLEILRRLEEFTSLGLPLLVGSSRKSFIGSTLGRETGDRVWGTAATVAAAVTGGASILRVHDIRAMRDTADMAHAIARAGTIPAEKN